MNVPASRPSARKAELVYEQRLTVAWFKSVYKPHKPVLSPVPLGSDERTFIPFINFLKSHRLQPQARCFLQTKYQVHILYRLARSAFDQIIDQADD